MSQDSRPVQARTDFYTVIHKALRKRLFEAIVLAGASDLGDANERATLERTVTDLVQSLRQHAEHEERYLHPIIADVLPEHERTLRAEHEEHHRALDEVERDVALAVSERSPDAGHRAYLTLARFAAHFLSHIEEEERSQPHLWQQAGEARFAAAMTAFMRSRTLEQTLAGFADMLPAMNAAERRELFGRLRAGAPEALLVGATQLAERILGERAFGASQPACGG